MPDKEKSDATAVRKLTEYVRAEFAERPSAATRNWIAVLVLVAGGAYAIISIVPVRVWSHAVFVLLFGLFVRRLMRRGWLTKQDLVRMLLALGLIATMIGAWALAVSRLVAKLHSAGVGSATQPASEAQSWLSVASAFVPAIVISLSVACVVAVYNRRHVVGLSLKLIEWLEYLSERDESHEARISTLEQVAGVDDHEPDS